MLDQLIGLSESQPQLSRETAHEYFSKFSSKELMDALMEADMPMGGPDERRIERLLSLGYPQDVLQYFRQDALQRVAHAYLTGSR